MIREYLIVCMSHYLVVYLVTLGRAILEHIFDYIL
jgi:hypothetical protein